MPPRVSAPAWRRPETVVETEDRLRIEQILAQSRLFLAAVAATATYIDPTEPKVFAAGAYALLGVYVVVAALISVLAHWAPARLLNALPAVHAVDISTAALVTVLTQGPSSPFFVFFTFVLMAAALRWGPRPTIVTGGAIIGWYLIEVLLYQRYTEATFDVPSLVLKAAYLLVATLVLAELAGAFNIFTTESALVSRLLARIKRGEGFTATLQHVVEECLRYTDGDHARLVLRDDELGRVYCWQVRRSQPQAAATPSLVELTADEADAVFATMPPGAATWRAVRGSDGVRVRALDETGALGWIKSPPEAHRALLEAARADTYTAVRVPVAGWDVCLFLFDARQVDTTALRFLRRMAGQVAPAMHGQYLMARVRARIGDLERARLSRELHDGLIQSLVGLEMQIDALRRQLGGPDTAAELRTVQARLHDAILDTRDLMTHLKPHSDAREGLLNQLTVLIDRFRSDTGVDARLTSTVDEVDTPARTAHEVARIVQEALVNVRKHAGARHVVVRLSRESSHWQLAIDDDGRGFSFEGRLTQEELDRQRRGPVVIKERVRAIGGELTIESSPGQGSRLVIVWPLGRRTLVQSRA